MRTKTAGRSRDMDMTQGVIWKQLLLFALPLMAGNIFQQLYNTVDSIVVGNFVGKEALAAVGSVGPIINSLIGFFMGLATGAGVVISQSYGAKDTRRVVKTVHTTMLMTFGLCVILTGIGVLATPFMLRLMKTPDDVFGEASSYLRLYFAGVSGLLIYNMGAGILRAVGDSKRPLYFLIFSACLNTVLDVLFVAALHMGIAGAAWATIISQALSAAMIMALLIRTEDVYGIRLSELKMDWRILRAVVRVGFPAAIQQMITSVSNIFVQSYINAYGSSVMAGWSTYGKIDQFMILPMQSVALAITTFVGQNYGAGKADRIRQGTNSAIALSEIVTFIIMVPLVIFAPFMVKLFNGDSEVIHYGALFLRIMSPFYLFCCLNQVYASALRGIGDAKAPMFIMLGSFVVFRQIYLFTVSHLFGSVIPVALGYPMGWILCSMILLFYYHAKSKKYFTRLAVPREHEPAL